MSKKLNNGPEVRETILRKLSEIRIPDDYMLLYSCESPPEKTVHGISRWNLLLRGTLVFRCYEQGKFMIRTIQAPAVYYCTADGYQWLTADKERKTLSFCYYGDYIRVVWADSLEEFLYYHSLKPFSSGCFKYIAALETLFAEKCDEALLKQLLNNLFALTMEHINADSGSEYSKINMRWTQINEFLRTHRIEKFTRSEIAAIFQISPGSLSRLSRKNAGMEFAILRLHYRLEIAAGLLRSTDLPIKQITSECGFCYTSYFHRCFLREYGLTPTQYRNRRQELHIDSCRVFAEF